MPRPFGRDRIVGLREGKLFLSCAEPKGWNARVPKAGTSTEHPGTCVRWEEQLFEVEDLETRTDGGLTYTLVRWDERHAIRVIVTYDAGTDAGSLPASVQERLEHEYNVRGSTMSLVSAVPLWILGWISLILLLASSIGGVRILPTPVLVLGVYFLVESSVRLAVCIPQGRPIGSPLGTLVYEVWHRFGRLPD